MNKKYKHIFFDLDHTMWDFDKNATEVLQELYDEFGFHELGYFRKEEFVDVFHTVNRDLWQMHDKGKINKNIIRNDRFKLIFNRLGLPDHHIPLEIGTLYLKLCPVKCNVIPFAHEVLAYLSKNYVLHILTNGFDDVQQLKLKSARLDSYFIEIITADTSGSKKPSLEMFEFALKKAGAENHECVMIGDNLEADIAGARNARIDQIFFNPYDISHNEKITHEIKCLSELFKLF